MVKHRHSWGQFSDQSEIVVSAKRRKLSDMRGTEFRLCSMEGLPEEVPFTLEAKEKEGACQGLGGGNAVPGRGTAYVREAPR